MNRNMVHLKSLAACLAAGCAAVAASAGPAWHGVMTLSQPDGTSIQARLAGDEAAHVMTDLGGRALVQNGDGFWCYALYGVDGSVHSSGEIAGDASVSMKNAGSYVPYAALNLKAAERRRICAEESRKLSEQEPLGKRNVLIILAQFKDVKMTHGREAFSRLVNGGNLSAKKYFTDQFLGACEFNFTIGPLVTLSRTLDYYGHNVNGSDANAAEAVAEACRLAADEGVDFSAYDDDGDGEVDNVFVFTAGKDEADGGGDDAIWSNSWFLERAGISLSLGGKKINRYAMCSELGRGEDGRFKLAGIGTFCHEMGHVLGLVDMYNTELRSSETAKGCLWGSTSIMDHGGRNNDGRTPPYYNAIERDMLGIGHPEPLAEGSYVLEPIGENGRYLRYDTHVEGEYYLVECRSTSDWDMYAGGKGLAIYHVDRSAVSTGYSKVLDRDATAAERWASNEVNCIPEHECADMIEACPDAEDVSQVFFPYGKNNEFSSSSSPAFRFWDGTSSPLAIKDIMIAGNNVEFRVVRNSAASPATAVDVKMQVFQNTAILHWSSDAPEDSSPAKVVWGPPGVDGKEVDVFPYQEGRYALRLEGLSPHTAYRAVICYESDGGKGKEVNVRFVTKRMYPDGYPFMLLSDMERNDDGSFKAGAKMPMVVFNLNNARAVEWFMDGRPVSPGSDGFFRVDRTCTITARITYIDGATDVIEKRMIVK